MPSARSKRRIVRRSVFSILLGAMLNFTFAWGSIVWMKHVSSPSIQDASVYDQYYAGGKRIRVEYPYGCTIASFVRINPDTLRYFFEGEPHSINTSPIPEWVLATALESSASDVTVAGIEAGWPWGVFRTLYVAEQDFTPENEIEYLWTGPPPPVVVVHDWEFEAQWAARITGGITRFPKPHTLLPTGVVGNTALFAIVIFVLLTAIIEGRMAWRRKCGRCPRCAYDLNADFGAGCPECGWNREPSTATQPA